MLDGLHISKRYAFTRFVSPAVLDWARARDLHGVDNKDTDENLTRKYVN